MSYCVQCGVKLSDYHGNCPLCNTEVVNPNTTLVRTNTDYPDYRVEDKKEKKRIRNFATGFILSLQAFVYSLIVVLLDWLTGDGINWSLIPVISLALLWVTVAYPFFRKKNTFFRLFTYDCISVIIYILLLNFLISGNFIWSRYVAVSVLFLWVIIAGIFITDRIRKVLPITIYYIISSVIITFISLSFVEQKILLLQLGLPIMISFFVISLISYFIIKSSSGGVLNLLIVLLIGTTLMCMITDVILNYYNNSSFGFSFSIIVAVVEVPLAATLFTIKKSNELYSLLSRKLHR